MAESSVSHLSCPLFALHARGTTQYVDCCALGLSIPTTSNQAVAEYAALTADGESILGGF